MFLDFLQLGFGDLGVRGGGGGGRRTWSCGFGECWLMRRRYPGLGGGGGRRRLES